MGSLKWLKTRAIACIVIKNTFFIAGVLEKIGVQVKEKGTGAYLPLVLRGSRIMPEPKKGFLR
jgi:hypothetical protein